MISRSYEWREMVYMASSMLDNDVEWLHGIIHYEQWCLGRLGSSVDDMSLPHVKLFFDHFLHMCHNVIAPRVPILFRHISL